MANKKNQTIKLGNTISKKLKKFARECNKALIEDRKNLHQVEYPAGCLDGYWPVEEIEKLNPNLSSFLNKKGNVYAILIRKFGSNEWSPKYVGQRKADDLGGRIRQHLIDKHKKTGSKLGDVKQAVSEGQEIAVTYIMVRPESLRHFVEEKIIAANSNLLTWNKHGR